MKKNYGVLLAMLVVMATGLSSCELIGDVIQFSFAVVAIIILIVVLIIWWIVRKFRN